MKKKSLKRWIVDLGICAAMFVISVAVGVTLGEVFAIREQITAVFIFSVFLVSLLTDGYASGIIMTVLSVVFINYAFFPPVLRLRLHPARERSFHRHNAGHLTWHKHPHNSS